MDEGDFDFFGADECEIKHLWTRPDGRIFGDTSIQACDFLSAYAEPVCRQGRIHEYVVTPESMYKAFSVGLDAETIVSELDRLSKNKPSKELIDFIHASNANYWKLTLVSKNNRYYIEAPLKVMEALASDFAIAMPSDGFTNYKTAHGGETYSFEIHPSQVENVKQSCLPNALNFPMRQEYDFKNDNAIPDLDLELKPHAQVSPNGDPILSRMFGNGRARSGIMVLPRGDITSLVCVSAAARIKKSCLFLATSDASADQWVKYFKICSRIRDDQICRFTSEYSKELFHGNAGVVVTTYFDMVPPDGGTQFEESKKIREEIRNIEWGLLLMDEVIRVPDRMLKSVIATTKSHCKLGLTNAFGQDDKIADLKFLVGPKLYEVYWPSVLERGFNADVKCCEVYCDMTKEFMTEYLKNDKSEIKEALYVMNPNKLRACEYLIRDHEERGDKIMVFGENMYALEEYATKLQKPIICDQTLRPEQAKILEAFKTSKDTNTVFLPKSLVVEYSSDIPEASVIIQISSHPWSGSEEIDIFNRFRKAKGEHEGRLGCGEDNAFFYSLVSTCTEEMDYSVLSKAYFAMEEHKSEVITSLPPADDTGSSLCNYSHEQELSLLAKVLNGEGTLFPCSVSVQREAATDTAGVMIDFDSVQPEAVTRTVGVMIDSEQLEPVQQLEAGVTRRDQFLEPFVKAMVSKECHRFRRRYLPSK